MFFWIFICFVEFISTNSQIITQTIAQISQHSHLHSPTNFGNSLLSFKEIVRQKTSGNQLQQCPCVTFPGSDKCISYDSRFQAASLEEAILTFVDTSMDPRIFDDRLGQPIGGGTFLCGTEECRQCAALLVLRLREINLIRGPPGFSFRLPAVNQIRPELCRRLRLGQSISIPPSPTPVPGYVAEMIRQGLTQRAAQTSSRPVSAFGAMVQRAIQLAREFKGRPFFDAVLKERQERLQNTRRIQNDGGRNANSGSGGGRSSSGGGKSGNQGQSGNVGSSGGSRGFPGGNNGGGSGSLGGRGGSRGGGFGNVGSTSGSRGNSGGNTGGRGQGRSSSGISGERGGFRGGSSGGGGSVGNGGRPSPGNNGNSGRNPSRQQSNQPGSRLPINQPGPVVRPLIQRARNVFQNRQNQIQVQTPQQPVQQVVQQPFQQQSVQQQQFQQQFVQQQQQFVQPQQQFQQPFQQPALSSISSVAQQSQPWAWNAALWSTTSALQGTGQSSGGSGVGVGWGGGGGGGGGSGFENNQQQRSGGGVGIAGAIASLFGRKKRAISDQIIGDRFVISCVERGDAENDATDFINLCTACWTWRQLPSDYFPRLINELVCQENDFCLSGWGSCQQRYRNVDVLRRGSNGWQPTTISVASCCDCKVKAGSEVHALVIGDNKR